MSFVRSMVFGEDTKVGDRVLVKSLHGWREDTILKVMPSQVLISHDRFVRRTGIRLGDRHYMSARTTAVPLTPEEQARWDARIARDKHLRRLSEAATALRNLRVTDEHIDAIERFLDELKRSE